MKGEKEAANRPEAPDSEWYDWHRAHEPMPDPEDDQYEPPVPAPLTPPARSAPEPKGQPTMVNEPDDEPIPGLFRRWTMGELLAEPDHFEWLIKGMFAEPTYAVIAGEMKTLKSYVDGFITIGLAAGVEIFDRFKPPAARPVVSYVGEGGRLPYTRRMRRIAEAMGVNLGEIPLYPSFDVAPILSERFQRSFARDLADIEPGLVNVDPYYTFHGSAIESSKLHAEATVLNAMSGPCMDAGASLTVVNHMNQTGNGMSLKRITSAGSGEWADSWILLGHREDPDVENGHFQLELEIGSRQWGGTYWELDLDIGRFDEDSGTHDGDITWDLRRASTGSGKAAEKKAEKKATDAERKLQDTRAAILATLAAKPWTLSKDGLYKTVGGNHSIFIMAMDGLVSEGVIKQERMLHSEGGVDKRRVLWGLVPNLSQIVGGHVGTGWPQTSA